MARARAIAVFEVRHGRIRIKVRVLPTARDVDREYARTPGARGRSGYETRGFTLPQTFEGSRFTITLAASGSNLDDDIPHEVSHAVLWSQRVVSREEDEAFATAVGRLCARIRRQIARRGLDVQP